VFSVSVSEDDYLLVIVSGQGTLPRYRAVASFIGELLTSARGYRALIDLMAAHPVLTREEHRELARQVSDEWAHAHVAVVVPSVLEAAVGEWASLATGANIQVFTNLHDAGDWLRVVPQGA
jgi:hypothetical protein